MKKLSSIIIMVIIMTLLTSTFAFASSAASKITVTANDKVVRYDVKPYMKDGVVMVPVKRTAEALGAKVESDKKAKTVWVHLDMMHVEIPIGKSEFYIHRDADFSGIPQTVKLDTTIKSIRGRVFVPGKVFFESLGMKVNWDSKKKVLSIVKESALTGTDVVYDEITSDDILSNKALTKWYNDNNQKKGINFINDGKYVYVLIGAGERPTGGFTIKIDRAYYSAEDTVTINAKVNPPADNVRVIMMITYPSTLIRIKSDTITSVNGDVVDAQTGKEKWITLDSTTVAKMELYNLDQAKIRDITGTEEENIMKSFNEATLDPNSYIEMIAGNILKVTTNDGYVLTFTSYGSETNVIVNFAKDGDNRTFHLVAPVIAKTLLAK